MSRRFACAIAVLLGVGLIAASCSDDGDDSGDGGSDTTAAEAVEIDYEALGLWDDGPCDESMEPLTIGMMTVFESPVLSLEDQALALEAAAAGFNERGGANGACIEVVTCDDGANAEQATACVREIDEAGVVATVNDTGSTAQEEVSAAMAQVGVPRVAVNVTSSDWGDPNAYPMHASSTGVTFLLPQALIDEGTTDIGLIRVDLPEASALTGLLGDLYPDATFDPDLPVPAGATDFSQYILGTQDAGAGGAVILLGEQEAVQVVRAGQQLGSDLQIAASLGSFPHSTVAELGDFAEQMVFMWSYPPATVDLPAYEAMRADFAASGEESIEVQNVKASPMASWIGLYSLLYMIREADMTEFTREGITEMLQTASDIPMLGVFGDDTWTPNENREGLWERAGTDHWAAYRWDPEAEAPGGLEGNFVEVATYSFDEVLCGSPFGAAGPC